MGCKGIHCDGCGGRGSGPLVIIGAGVALALGSGAVAHAASDALSLLVIIGAGSLGLTVLALAVAIVLRVRRGPRMIIPERPASGYRAQVLTVTPERVTERRYRALPSADSRTPERPATGFLVTPERES